jgi:hypothetical protein
MATSKPGRILLTLVLAALLMLALVVSGFTLVEGPNRSVSNIGSLQALTNAIQNGDFEQNPASSIATYWQPYDNGQAHFGWYDEKWPEAVHSGKHSQLMEIFLVEGNAPDRVIGIYQTVNVVPNRVYSLTFFALMRTDAPIELRNKDQYGMDWGIDYSGQGKYHLVQTWLPMTMTEQLRIGSNSVSNDEPGHLFYELITGTIYTANSSQLTLFIRGVKREPTGTEVNFNVDDVSLLGPYPPPPTPTSTPLPTPTFLPLPTFTPTPTVTSTPTPIPPPATPIAGPPPLPITGDSAVPDQEQNNLPDAGTVVPKDIPFSALLFGGLLLIVLGASAAGAVLLRRRP